ncbi:TetR/AcrR family transcriptional regulator [Pseudomonas corrugata]|uniref:TetR/AcrR family transcriptional regulator n=1 Tax=Pseudomonas corrugata TaxID=47879 RepID=UPI0015863CFE|nr:TetR/AcrR family transcriptional regulator [Pseudomonas corrugata]MCI0996995.1 TetR/AcrR family transcriptional regulator [Pseudomonas corrugata]NUT64698.1 TetR/AcrR family transcriptional regulator [Pseudomonas corrugata]
MTEHMSKMPKNVATAKKSTTPPGKTARSSRKMRSSGPEQSISRIIDATHEAISRQGFKHLSMSDICRISGVARGTLYRYFPTKEDLLEGIAGRVRQRFEDGLEAISLLPHTPYERLDAVLDFLADSTHEAKTELILEVEPLFVLDFLNRQLPHYSELLSRALDPLFTEIQLQTGRAVDPLNFSNLLLRLNTSIVLLPPPEKSPAQFKQMLISTVVNLLGTPPPANATKKKQTARKP